MPNSISPARAGLATLLLLAQFVASTGAMADTVVVTPLAPLGAGAEAGAIAANGAAAEELDAATIGEALPGEAGVAMPDNLPVRLRVPRARKALAPGLDAAGEVTDEIARAEDATTQARAVSKAKPVEEPPSMPKVKSPLAVAGAKIGEALDAVGSPIKPDRIKIYAGSKTMTIPVPRD